MEEIYLIDNLLNIYCFYLFFIIIILIKMRDFWFLDIGLNKDYIMEIDSCL